MTDLPPMDPDSPDIMNGLSESDYINRTERWIREIRASTDLEHLRSEVAMLMSYSHAMSLVFQSGNRRFVRARKNIPASKIFNKPSDLWHPPASKVGEGRANLKNRPVLYISNSTKVALTEIRALVGDVVTVGHYKVKDGALLNLLEIGVLGHCSEEFAVVNHEACLATLRQCGYTDIGLKNHTNLRRFIRNEFLRDESSENAYKITSAIVQGAYDSRDFDGVIYSSKQSEDAWNIALTPVSAKQKIRLTRCHMLRIEEVLEDGYKVMPLQTCSLIGRRRLKWTDRIPHLVHEV